METRTEWGYLPLVPPRSSQTLQQFGAQKPLSFQTMVRTRRFVLEDRSSPRTPDTRPQTLDSRLRLVGAVQVPSPEVQAGLGSNKAGSRGQVVK